MSKSILVIDTPESCIKCPLIKPISTFTSQGYSCSRNDKKINHILDKPDWCPLLDLPEKYEPVSMNFERGFNACIDEILKDVFKNSIPYDGDNIGNRG